MEDKCLADLNFFKQIAAYEIEQFMEKLDLQALEAAVHLILLSERNGGRVHITGIGKPSYVAGYIASLYSSTGTPSYFLDGTEAVHGSSGQVHPGDVVIAISNSGGTRQLLETITALKNNGAKIIGVTGNSESELAYQADIFIFAGVNEEGGPLNKAPRISFLHEVFVLQALSVLLQSKKSVSLLEYKAWHPAGALGESIH